MKTTQQQVIPAEGIVLENLPGAQFRVRIEKATEKPELTSNVVLCTMAGKMRMNWVRLLPGDKVAVDVSSLDPTRGRITYKLK